MMQAKTAGGMTSVCRQIGIGCEKPFRRALREFLQLSDADVAWSYKVLVPSGLKRNLYFAGRVSLEKIPARIIHECRCEVFKTEARRARRSDGVAGLHE
jgi:hypothetical protein